MVRAKETLMQTERMVGYSSMEIALEAGLPTYSGGLGVLAGDTMLNMTYLALNLSHYVNGVAKKHAEVSQIGRAHV